MIKYLKNNRVAGGLTFILSLLTFIYLICHDDIEHRKTTPELWRVKRWHFYVHFLLPESYYSWAVVLSQIIL